ncbi:MAG: hypothetical protein ABFD64_04655 [Armatimonadota bacterium]
MINPFRIFEYIVGVQVAVCVPIAIAAGVRLRAASAKLISYLKTERPEQDNWQKTSMRTDGAISKLIRFFKYVYSDADNDDDAIREQKFQVRQASRKTLVFMLQVVCSIIALLIAMYVLEPTWKHLK